MDDVASTQAFSPDPRTVVYPRGRWTVIEGPDRGLVREVGAAELSIGKGRANDLVLTDTLVSRFHAVIAATPRGLLLRDVGSTNGTTIDGLRVEAAYLRPGARVGMGQTVIQFDPLADGVAEPLAPDDRWGAVLGTSAAMRALFAKLPRLAAADTTLLIEGETGTGKSLLADAIHRASPRAAARFVVVDCAAIPPSLIESELFGHDKGAFTGAHAARAGAFEAARGGTVFLDEIGELPLELQPRLLRLLEDRVVKRIGSQTPIQLDVRVIAATNRDLRQEVNRGAFRADLFYRLATVRLTMPPLRDRVDDIPGLIAKFWTQFRTDDQPEAAPAELIDHAVRHGWPGNIRELRSAVERMLLLGELGAGEAASESGAEPGAAVAASASRATAGELELRDRFDPARSFRAAKEQIVTRWERWYLQQLLAATGGNVTRAARLVRADRHHLRDLIRRHAIEVDQED